MKVLKFICTSLIILFVVSACKKNDTEPEEPVQEETVIRDASFPELKIAIQGQWMLIQKEEETTGEKTVYSFRDSPFWLRFEDDDLSLKNALNEFNDFYLFGRNASWGEVSIQKEVYPCFFYSDGQNHYVVKEINDSLLVINDSDAKGVKYKFAKTEKSSLSGTNWILSAFCNTEGDITSVGITKCKISFDEFRCSGRSVVNSIKLVYAVDGSNFCILDGFITLVGCECCDCELSDHYENAVLKISHFDYTKSELKLFYSDTEYMLFFSDLSTD